ncbi:MAG: hypothetical protein JXR03_14470 [Cyclobacteriaceae bacterium]
MNKKDRVEKSKIKLYILVGILAITSLVYRLLVINHFEQTTLLFIGLPALLTVLVVKFVDTPKSVYGVTFKVITLFLLMSGILLGEGIVCIIFAAPLFYGVAALIIFVSNKFKDNNKLNAILFAPLFVFGSVLLETKQTNTVVVSYEVAKDVSLNNLNTSPDFMRNMPSFFKIGFPKPILIDGTGLSKGDYRKIEFESSTKGIGVLHLAVAEKGKDKVVFNVVSDDTHINHWLSWKKVIITLNQDESGANTVVWTTMYECNLNPSWYFEPLERIAIYQSTNHLIRSYFGEN